MRVHIMMLLLLAACVHLAGCQAKPPRLAPFSDPEIRTLAVVPFGYEPAKEGFIESGNFFGCGQPFEYDRPGVQFARRLAAQLKARGTYKVVDAEALAKSADIDLSPAKPFSQTSALAPLRKAGGVDAYITGVVKKQRVAESTRIDYHDTMPGDSYSDETYWGPHGRWMAPSPTIYYINQGQFEVSFSLIRVSDGKVLYETTRPVEGNIKLVEYVPRPPKELLDLAIDNVVAQVALALTPPPAATATTMPTSAKGP